MTILLIEEDIELSRRIATRFRHLGKSIDAVHDGESGLSIAGRIQYSAVVLAWELKGFSGLQVLRELRAVWYRAPILILGPYPQLSLHARSVSRELGVDEFLDKPIDIESLVLRVDELIDRARTPEVILAGTLALNLRDRQAARSGKALTLSPLEFSLLHYLALNLDQLVTRNMLLENVWRINFDPHTSVIESHMSRLRAKVNKGFDEDVIQTVRNRGYKLVSRP